MTTVHSWRVQCRHPRSDKEPHVFCNSSVCAFPADICMLYHFNPDLQEISRCVSGPRDMSADLPLGQQHRGPWNSLYHIVTYRHGDRRIPIWLVLLMKTLATELSQEARRYDACYAHNPQRKAVNGTKSGLEQAGLPPRILKTRSVPLCLTPKECPSIWKDDPRERRLERCRLDSISRSQLVKLPGVNKLCGQIRVPPDAKGPSTRPHGGVICSNRGGTRCACTRRIKRSSIGL